MNILLEPGYELVVTKEGLPVAQRDACSDGFFLRAIKGRKAIEIYITGRAIWLLADAAVRHWRQQQNKESEATP